MSVHILHEWFVRMDGSMGEICRIERWRKCKEETGLRVQGVAQSMISRDKIRSTLASNEK